MNAIDCSKYNIADFSSRHVRGKYHMFALPKRLGFDNIDAMLRLVARTLRRIKFEVDAQASSSPAKLSKLK
jgi:hypothetical protein